MWEWLKRQICGELSMTVEERRQDRRSKVRVFVTYWAALYIFGGAAALIALVLWGKISKDNFDVVREIFTLGLPIATGVITYWFATRQQGPAATPPAATPPAETPPADKAAVSPEPDSAQTAAEESREGSERPGSQSPASPTP